MMAANRWIVTFVMVGVLGWTARGQVGPMGDGRALDSNYRIGSGGYNAVRGGFGRVNSQLYITGQVTGLRRFRAEVPYVAANELRLDLPSAVLSDFRRASMGLPQVLAGSPYLAAPYFEPSQTVFNIRGIAAGLTVPGSSQPLTATPSPALVQRLHGEVTSEYKPVVGPRSGRALSPEPLIPLAPTGRAAPIVSPAETMVTRPGAAAPFAVLRQEDRRRLLRELYDLAVREQEEVEQAPGQVDAHVEARVETQIEAEVGRTSLSVPEAVERAEPSRRAEAEAEATRRTGVEPATGGERRALVRPPVAVPGPNQDVYLDLLLRLRERQLAERGEGGTSPLWTPRLLPRAGTGGFSRPRAPAPPPIDESDEEEGELVYFEPITEVLVIHGLAGVSPDLFNKHMGQAEKKLKAGKFYDAAGEYRFAMTVSPSNPLARMGLCLALFGAGEPLSAAIHLRRALQLLPPMMGTRLDLPAMLDEKIIAAQVKRLDKRLKEREEAAPDLQVRTEPGLAFLSAFIHHNLGQSAEAKEAARALQAAGGDDKLMQAYATFVLTGDRPDRKPSTAPTPATAPSE